MYKNLFRAKKESGEWVYGDLINSRGKKYVVPTNYFELDGHHLSCDSDTPVFILEETIGVSTLLPDKDNKIIYTGDIFRNAKGYDFVVRFEDGAFRIYDGNDFVLDSIEASMGRVVGNIYDDNIDELD